MGSVIQFNPRRRRPGTARSGAARPAQATAANMVSCLQCGEHHPIVRLQGGEERCVTAFFDGTHWFCRNRGCRRAWLSNKPD